MKRRIFTPKTAYPFLVFTALSVLLTLPTSACAQDDDGLAMLRRLGRIGREQGLAIGLATPMNMAKSAYEQIIKTGTVERGFLGVAFQTVTPAIAEAFDLEGATGAIVTDVVAGSAASEAGIRKNDIIETCNGVPVEPAARLLQLVASLKPGQKVELVLLRDGERQTLTVTLGKRPSLEANVPEDE